MGVKATGPVGEVNRYRAAQGAGLALLERHPILEAAAQWKAEAILRMAAADADGPALHGAGGKSAERNKTDHGYPPDSPGWGEIVAWGPDTFAGAMAVWRKSPPHDGSLRQPVFRAMGVGFAAGTAGNGHPHNVWVVCFGSVTGGSAADVGAEKAGQRGRRRERRRVRREDRRTGRAGGGAGDGDRDGRDGGGDAVPAGAASTRVLPSGPIETIRPNGQPFGTDWDGAYRHVGIFRDAEQEFGFPLEVMIGIWLVESDATHQRADGTVVVRKADDYDANPAVGGMQVKPAHHAWRLPGCDPYELRDNVRLGFKIMADATAEHGTWQRGFGAVYFPGDDRQTGTTRAGYVACAEALVDEQAAFARKGAKAVAEKPRRDAAPGPVSAKGAGEIPAGWTRYDVPGLPRPIALPFPLEVALIGKGQTNQRPGIAMRPDRYVQHQTGNRRPGADADHHRTYLEDGAPDDAGASQQLSYHLTVDDRKAIVLIPLDEVAWHGGDQGGPCNTRGIACELCMHEGIDGPKARENAAILCAEVMDAAGIGSLKPHQACAGKFCPEEILAEEGGWEAFVGDVGRRRRERG